ncbi:MAG: hypothetical protein ACTSRP_11695 [Candidatus Helarchaeota archaeon]
MRKIKSNKLKGLLISIILSINIVGLSFSIYVLDLCDFSFNHDDAYNEARELITAILSENYSLIRTDLKNDVYGGNISSIDIFNVYENREMSIIKVEFVDVVAKDNDSNNVYRYYCYIDKDHDNLTWEYKIFLEIGNQKTCFIEKNGVGYWDGSSWSATPGPNNYSYAANDYVIFNFSSCPETVGNNWYNIYSEYWNGSTLFNDTVLGDFNTLYYFEAQSDYEAPIIHYKNVFPTFLTSEDYFTVNVNVSDNLKLDTVSFILYNKSSNYISEHKLYDDGLHNDGLPNDYYFGAQYDVSSLSNGIYLISIKANDSVGNEAILDRVLSISVNYRTNFTLFDGMYLSYFYQYIPGRRNQVFHYKGNNIFEVSCNYTGFTPENGSYILNNATGWRSESNMHFYPARKYSGYFIPRNSKLGDVILNEFVKNPMKIVGTDWYLTGSSLSDLWVYCWELREQGGKGLAYYEINTGILVYFGNSTIYLDLDVTNAYLEENLPFIIKSPPNDTISDPAINVIVENYSKPDWIKFRIHNGSSWSSNYTLQYNGSVWTGFINLSDLYPSNYINRTFKLQIIIFLFWEELTTDVVFTIVNETEMPPEHTETTESNPIPGFDLVWSFTVLLLYALFTAIYQLNFSKRKSKIKKHAYRFLHYPMA